MNLGLFILVVALAGGLIGFAGWALGADGRIIFVVCFTIGTISGTMYLLKRNG